MKISNLLIVLLSIIISASVFAAPKKKTTYPHHLQSATDRLHFSTKGAFYEVGFNGEQRYLESPLAAGPAYHFFGADNATCLGLYLSPTLFIDQSGTGFAKWGGILDLRLFKGFGIGVKYDFWKTGDGFVEPRQDNLSLAITFAFGDL